MKEEPNEEEEKIFSNILSKGINDLLDSAPKEEPPDLSKELEINQKYEEKEIIEPEKQKDAYNANPTYQEQDPSNLVPLKIIIAIHISNFS